MGKYNPTEQGIYTPIYVTYNHKYY